MTASVSGIKYGDAAKALVVETQYKKLGIPQPTTKDTPETLAALPVWMRGATFAEPVKLYPTGGALLSKNHVVYSDSERVAGWKEILSAINWHPRYFVSRFLKDVLFFTNARP